MEESMNDVESKLNDKINDLKTVKENRSVFEERYNGSLRWLHEADVALSGEVRTTGLDVLQQQLTKVKKKHS